MANEASFSGNLRRLRLDRGMTQEQVAQRLGVTRQALSSHESGRTRPDIDMLERLCQVYGVTLEELLHSPPSPARTSPAEKIAAALLILLPLLTLSSSAFLWTANRFFPLAQGMLEPDAGSSVAVHLRLTGAWEAADGLSLTVSLLGSAALVLLLQMGKRPVSLRRKLRWLAVLAGAILLAAAPFAFTDPVFAPVDYYITPVHIILRTLLFLLVDLGAERIRKRRRSPCRPG